MGNPVLGVCLALVGTLCSAIGYTLQKLAHRRSDAAAHKVQHDKAHDELRQRERAEAEAAAEAEDSEVEGAPDALTAAVTAMGGGPADNAGPTPTPKRTSYWSYWQFPAGLGMLVLGSIFSVITAGMAGQAQLAPMSATTMIWNMVLAWRVLKEPFGRIDGASLGLMSLGTTIALLFAAKSDNDYSLDDIIGLLNRPIVWIYASASLTLILGYGAVVGHYGKRLPAQLTTKEAAIDSFGRSFVPGMLGGYTGFLVKSVVEVVFSAISSGDWSNMARFEPYLFILALVCCLFNQVRFMNSGLARYESSRIIPVYQSTLVFSGVAAGYIFFDEVSIQTTHSLTLFGVGCGVTMIGMLLLPLKPHHAHHTIMDAAANVTASHASVQSEAPAAGAHSHHVTVQIPKGPAPGVPTSKERPLLSPSKAFSSPHGGHRGGGFNESPTATTISCSHESQRSGDAPPLSHDAPSYVRHRPPQLSATPREGGQNSTNAAVAGSGEAVAAATGSSYVPPDTLAISPGIIAVLSRTSASAMQWASRQAASFRHSMSVSSGSGYSPVPRLGGSSGEEGGVATPQAGNPAGGVGATSGSGCNGVV